MLINRNDSTAWNDCTAGIYTGRAALMAKSSVVRCCIIAISTIDIYYLIFMVLICLSACTKSRMRSEHFKIKLVSLYQ